MTVCTYEARTARSVLIATFETEKQALKWWEDRSPEFPGCRLEHVTTQTIVIRRTIRRPKLELVTRTA